MQTNVVTRVQAIQQRAQLTFEMGKAIEQGPASLLDALEDLNSKAHREIGKELGRVAKRPEIADPFKEDVNTAPPDLLDPWDQLAQQLLQAPAADRPRMYREYFESAAQVASQVLARLADSRPANPAATRSRHRFIDKTP